MMILPIAIYTTQNSKIMPQNVDERYAQLLQPSQELINDIASLKGDIIVLGAGGKMGPALCTLAMSAINIAGASKKVVAISRFREEGVQQGLQAQGIHTINADLLNDNDLQSLPNAENVVYMAGMKFGSTANASLTWAMNTYLPGRVAEKYRSSNIVAFSTGNVYPLMDIKSGGATEEVAPEPVGEYAQSCLGRERMFQYFSTLNNTPVCIYRLNYANDVTYGVLLEIAKSVKEEKPIDLSMGYFNAIWQGDANEIALRALRHCTVPARLLNVTGPETISVKWTAEQFGKLFNKQPQFENVEQPTALLNDASESFRLLGKPNVSLNTMMSMIADWLIEGGKTINKPTHFQDRKGKY